MVFHRKFSTRVKVYAARLLQMIFFSVRLYGALYWANFHTSLSRSYNCWRTTMSLWCRCVIIYNLIHVIISSLSDGFRKVVNTEHGGLRCIKDDYQFVNKNFCRDKPELLELVKRKVCSVWCVCLCVASCVMLRVVSYVAWFLLPCVGRLFTGFLRLNCGIDYIGHVICNAHEIETEIDNKSRHKKVESQRHPK